jgi:3-polyprenyl-4-hydroxybenzoate decarboxylase
MFSQLPDFLKKEGDLIEIERELSPTFEIPAAVKIKPNLPGMPIDPSIRDDGMIAKVGIDVTKPLKDKERFKKVDIPKYIKEKVSRLMKKEGFD